MLAKDIMGVGMPAEFASREGYPAQAAVTAAGTTSATATVLLKEQRAILVTGSGSDGVRLPSTAEMMVPYVIAVTGGTTKVYPPTSGTFNGASADTPIAIVIQLCGVFMRYSSTGWFAIGTVAPA